MQAQREQLFAKDSKNRYDSNTERNIDAERSDEHGNHLSRAERLSDPNLLLPQEPEVHLGKYAELRRQYLKQHRRVLYTNLKTSCRLTEHLAEIEQTAQRMVAQAVAQMAKARA